MNNEKFMDKNSAKLATLVQQFFFTSEVKNRNTEIKENVLVKSILIDVHYIFYSQTSPIILNYVKIYLRQDKTLVCSKQPSRKHIKKISKYLKLIFYPQREIHNVNNL